ncbi:replicative DNA helicase [Thermomonas mangrovi]|uniref:replicative DNA helicase n=1 Tax=Thermomonas mangrovi TaxID=2993316 RepID=UPI002307DA87
MNAPLRVAPQSIEAEQAVLGGLMLAACGGLHPQARAWSDVADIVVEGDFYRRDHQLIFRAIKERQAQQKPCDPIVLGEWFEANGMAEQIAGAAYLGDLCNNTASAANIRAYAEIVADKARLRKLIDIGTVLVNDGFDPKGRDTIELIGQAQSRVAGLLDSEPCELEPVAPIMDRVFEHLSERSRFDGGIDGLTTGLDDFDQLTNGLHGGQLIVVAARPKMGKTTLAQNIAEHVAIQKQKAVAVFSFEMRPEELGDRMLASQGDIDADRIRRGNLDDHDWANASAAIKRMRTARIFVSRPKRARVEHVCAQARRQNAKARLGLVVIDYLQLMETGSDNRAQGIGDITRALKLLAVELDVPVVLLSQLNRDLEKRDNKRPLPSDLRDSGSIEQDADVVVFVYRDEVYNRDSRYAGTAELIVALQRNGPPGDCRVLYRGDRFRFENLPVGWEPRDPPHKTEGPGKSRGMRKKAGGQDAAAGGDA